MQYRCAHLTIQSDDAKVYSLPLWRRKMTTNGHAESSYTKASSSNGFESHKKEAKRRRRLDDLSFASPGPAFMGTPTDSEAGDDDSDAAVSRKRLSRHSSNIRLASANENNSHLETSSSGPSTSRHTAPTTEVPKPSPLFRNFKSTKAPLLSQGIKREMVNGIHPQSGTNVSNTSRRDPDTDPDRGANFEAEVKAAAPRLVKTSTTESASVTSLHRSPVRDKRTLSQSRHQHSTDRDLSRQRQPSSQANLVANVFNGEAGDKERLISSKKKQLDSVYKEHDLLVRELFHLTKVRLFFDSGMRCS